jgi:mono/diheme cytochrome c family protein
MLLIRVLLGSLLAALDPMKQMLLGVVVGFCIVPLAAFLFVKFGGMPVATKGKPLPFERFLAHVALDAAVNREADKRCPIEATEANLAAGAKIYQAQCMVCHASPDRAPTAIALGMYPKPPPLVRLDKKGVTDDSAGETYWKAKNGIRLTGMPGFGDSLSETELWQVSLLLQHAHELPSSVGKLLSEPSN